MKLVGINANLVIDGIIERFLSGAKRVFEETVRVKTIGDLFQEVKTNFIFYDMLLNLLSFLTF